MRLRQAIAAAALVLATAAPALASQGGPGDDVIYGTPGDDILTGGGGNDVIHSRGGADVVRGGPGTDACFVSLRDTVSGCEAIG